MQNHLNNLLSQASAYLQKENNLVCTKEEHLRSKSNPKAEDETIIVAKDNDMKADKVVELYLDLLKEKEKLAQAISKAKTNADIDIDSAISVNKAKQEAMSVFRYMAKLKASETVTGGRDYLINSEGNQTPYYYSIKSVKTIDFDRDQVKGIIGRLQRETDEASSKIDLLNVTLEVDYEPKYLIEDSFEDAYEKMA